MCRKVRYIALIWAAILGSLKAQEPPHNYYPGMVLVKFSKDILSQPNLLTITSGNILSDEIRTFLENHNFTSGEKVFKHFEPGDTLWTTKDGRSVKLIDLSTYYALKVDINADIPALSDSLMQMDGVLWAGPNWKVEPAGLYPNDPYFQNGYQWGLWDQYGVRADIRAPEAWEFQKGRNDVIVAVVDGGVDYNHEDLDPGDRSRVIQGIDTGSDDDDPMDDLSGDWGGHGTSVTGIIGAMTNNSQGVAGVMWNLKIMPVKVAGVHSIGPYHWEAAYEGDIADGIDWAREHGADVINLSLGGYAEWWHFWEDPINCAVANAFNVGIVVVAAMGNENTSEPLYPAGYYTTIAVGATNSRDQRASFSNYGFHIDVAAPGVNTYTTRRYNQYGGFSGTSCATPFVSGLAGLIIAEARDKGINFNNEDVRWLIRLTADDINEDDYPGWDEYVGYGRINAGRAMQVLNLPYQIITTQGVLTKVDNNFHMAFLNNPRYDLDAGTYWCDVYKLELNMTFSEPYEDTPLVWFSSRGFSGANPNSAREWLHKEISENSVEMHTFFYFIRRDAAGRTVNKWAPVNPYNYGLKAVIIGRKVINTPTQLSAQSNEVSVALTWRDNSDNEMGFLIYRSEDGQNFSVIDTLWTNGNGTGQRTYTDTNVVWEQNYTYKIKAFAQNFYSDFSNIANVTIALNSPTDFTASASSDYRSVTLTWTDRSRYNSGYEIQRIDEDGDTVVFTTGDVSTYMDGTAQPYHTYRYRIRAVDNGGHSSDWVEQVVFNTPHWTFQGPIRWIRTVWAGDWLYVFYACPINSGARNSQIFYRYSPDGSWSFSPEYSLNTSYGINPYKFKVAGERTGHRVGVLYRLQDNHGGPMYFYLKIVEGGDVSNEIQIPLEGIYGQNSNGDGDLFWKPGTDTLLITLARGDFAEPFWGVDARSDTIWSLVPNTLYLFDNQVHEVVGQDEILSTVFGPTWIMSYSDSTGQRDTLSMISYPIQSGTPYVPSDSIYDLSASRTLLALREGDTAKVLWYYVDGPSSSSILAWTQPYTAFIYTTSDSSPVHLEVAKWGLDEYMVVYDPQILS